MTKLGAPQSIRRFLRPPESSLGPEFTKEVRQKALRGWRLSSWMALVAGLLFTIPYKVFLASYFPAVLPPLGGIILAGGLGILFSHTGWGQKHPRGISMLFALFIGTLLVYSQIVSGSHVYGHFGALSMILLVMAGLGTLRPLSVLLASAYFFLLYLAAGILLDKTVGWPPPATFVFPCVSLGVAGILAVWLTAASHQSLRTAFLLRDELSGSLRRLHDTQAQLLASEKALSQSQLVAALSHELNTPFGVLLSNLKTEEQLFLRLKQKLAERGVEDLDTAKWFDLHGELNRGSVQSCQRISDLLEKLRSFTHLDESEQKTVDLNQELLAALELVKAETGMSPSVEIDLEPLPAIVVEAQKVGLALASLLRQAFRSLNEGGVVRLVSHHRDAHVQIVIEQNGEGLDPQEQKQLFDPTFVPKEGRVRALWDMATSRQIFVQHEGTLVIESPPDGGTRAIVRLPVV